jgi:hypothetical protein
VRNDGDGLDGIGERKSNVERLGVIYPPESTYLHPDQGHIWQNTRSVSEKKSFFAAQFLSSGNSIQEPAVRQKHRAAA